MGLIQKYVIGTGTGAVQDTAWYTVPAGRNLYIRFVSLRYNAVATATQYIALFDSTNTRYPVILFGSTNVNSLDASVGGKKGICFAAGTVIELEDLLPATAWAAYFEGDLV